MSGGGAEEEANLEFTPTWVVAAVCTVIVAISLAAERFLHYGGKFLKNKNQKPLYEALQKIKEELMLLGFISLLLTVSQNGITKICVPPSVTRHMLPCSLDEKEKVTVEHLLGQDRFHFERFFSFPRRLLAETQGTETETHALAKTEFCARKNKVPLLSVEALHHLHIFIFVLAVVHVTFSVLTVIFGGARIRQWKHWEDSIAKQNYETDQVLKRKVVDVQQHDFIKGRFSGFGKDSAIVGWLKSFFKQFYGSVTKSDYVTLRHGFIMTHCKANPKFNFHKYMIRALEDDFKQVVGISWYLWVFVVIFLLLNINGMEHYFEFHNYVSPLHLLPFYSITLLTTNQDMDNPLLLAVGTKLEHVITQLAHEVTYGFDSCIMGQVCYIVPRLIIGVFIQVLCSYSTLPLYAIVTQMGTHFKAAIFREHVQVRLAGWAQEAKKKKGVKADSQAGEGSSHAVAGIQLGSVFQKRASAAEDGASVPKVEGSAE
ncbi:hypothetical protein Ahy_A07g035720 isoform B [Arachis hypogaea]|uniref:MLO-like protein n=1 Tax=Arachis hypogaea TaxID=3818 RepID=A0A445CEC0_ARAHY|nr:hypothetical protein Ahy_A07g035720 isoform B [Arachis hypogaea]